MQGFDPIRHILEHVPAEENELTYFEKQVQFLLPIFAICGTCSNLFIYMGKIFSGFSAESFFCLTKNSGIHPFTCELGRNLLLFYTRSRWKNLSHLDILGLFLVFNAILNTNLAFFCWFTAPSFGDLCRRGGLTLAIVWFRNKGSFFWSIALSVRNLVTGCTNRLVRKLVTVVRNDS